MKLIAQIDDKTVNVELIRSGEKVFAEIDGRKYELKATQVEKDVYLLKHENKVYEFFVDPAADSGGFIVKADSENFEIGITDPKSLRRSSSASAGADGVVEIKTAMPGKIVRVLFNEGDDVKQGEGVIIVEAMKMQNEMKSPKDGVIRQLRFSEGDTVNAGDILAVIE